MSEVETDNPRLGIKVPMGEHKAIHKSERYDGYDVTCSCGWGTSVLFPATLHISEAQAGVAASLANHIRHMSLVHDVQTHANDYCGRICIYPKRRPKAE